MVFRRIKIEIAFCVVMGVCVWHIHETKEDQKFLRVFIGSKIFIWSNIIDLLLCDLSIFAGKFIWYMNVNHFLTIRSFNSLTFPILGLGYKSTHEKIVLYYLQQFGGENEHNRRLVCLWVNLEHMEIAPDKHLLRPTYLIDIKFELNLILNL